MSEYVLTDEDLALEELCFKEGCSAASRPSGRYHYHLTGLGEAVLNLVANWPPAEKEEQA